MHQNERFKNAVLRKGDPGGRRHREEGSVIR